MRYAKMRSLDINNGPGVCATLFVQGCNRNCPGCFNPETHDFNEGLIWNRRCHLQFIEACKAEYIKYVCILGGEPLDQDEDLLHLLKEIKEIVRKPIWMWTGYTFEDVFVPKGYVTNASVNVKRYMQQNILSYVDVLIDGPFVESLSDKNLKYRGSTNQRVLNLQESIKQNTAVLMKEYYEI